jgi:hypothetical protein
MAESYIGDASVLPNLGDRRTLQAVACEVVGDIVDVRVFVDVMLTCHTRLKVGIIGNLKLETAR